MIYLPNTDESVTVFVPRTRTYSTRMVPNGLACYSTENLQYGTLPISAAEMLDGYWKVTIFGLQGMPSGEFRYVLVSRTGIEMETGMLLHDEIDPQEQIEGSFDEDIYYITITPEYGEE